MDTDLDQENPVYSLVKNVWLWWQPTQSIACGSQFDQEALQLNGKKAFERLCLPIFYLDSKVTKRFSLEHISNIHVTFKSGDTRWLENTLLKCFFLLLYYFLLLTVFQIHLFSHSNKTNHFTSISWDKLTRKKYPISIPILNQTTRWSERAEEAWPWSCCLRLLFTCDLVCFCR